MIRRTLLLGLIAVTSVLPLAFVTPDDAPLMVNDEDDFPGEQGLVDVEVLRRHLPGHLASYQLLICRPPPMVESLTNELAHAGVAQIRIRYELFST